MPGYEFQDVTVSAFDVHTTIDPHLPGATGFFQNTFAFLRSAKPYNQAYWSPRAAQTPHFSFRGLPRRVLRNHLWRPYIGRMRSNAWALELPLVGHPPSRLLRLNGETNDQAKARLRVYLSPLGWSTSIFIRLRKYIPNQELIEFVAGLTGQAFQAKGTPAGSPLLLDGTPKSLSDIFRQVETWLFEEVYVPGHRPHPHMPIPRHMVVSLNKFEGDVVDYRSMAAADQGLMLSILYGRKIGALDVEPLDVEPSTNPSYLWTRISGPNFALTDFNHGTLVFAQREAQKPQGATAVHCLANNIRDCLMLAFNLLHFHTQAQKHAPNAGARTRVALLRKNVQVNLARLRRNYPNQFCQNLFRQHRKLDQLSTS